MAFAALIALLAAVGPARAVTTSYWEIRSVDDLFAGEEAVGVTIDSDGALSRGAAWDSLATKIEGASYVWAAARDSKGRVWLGTGDEGRLYRWTPGGGLTLVWDTEASEITSLAIDAADNVYAGSTPGGVIYRVGAKGDTTRYYETGESSVWCLLAGKDGALYAGTGSAGKIFKITGPKTGTLLAETRDANVMALAQSPDGALLAGTAGKGLLLRVERSGATRVLYDADADELRAIALLDDGSIAVGTNRTQSGRSGAAAGSGGRGANPFAIEVTPQAGGKCGIFLVQPDGSARALYSPPCEFIYALRPAGPKSVLAATGNPAAILRIDTDRKYALLAAPREKQVLALAGSGDVLYAVTGNPAALFALGPGKANEGRYISDAHDLRSVASWGRFSARVAGGGEALLSTRSGFGETPDEGWSAWSADAPLRGGDAPISSPPARFLQYRLRLKGSVSDGPSISTIDLSYVPRNLAPELGAIRLYGPDQLFMEGGPEFRPPQISQTFSSGLKVEYSYPRFGPRPVSDASAAWARGIRTVAWDGLDPNGDEVTYDVYLKAADETAWRHVAKEISERLYSWDAESYPNGDYRVKVVASDKRGNPPGSDLQTERMSAPFRIDNVPPRVETLRAAIQKGKGTGTGAKATIVVTGVAIDADSRISTIEYSLDGGDWTQVFPKDGIYDQREESFEFVIPEVERGERAVTVRASDQDRNVAVGKVLSAAP
ncbi:MAG: two-component regulator propeller domain-containing protein [Candidatus Eisenbacteria bacterium]